MQRDRRYLAGAAVMRCWSGPVPLSRYSETPEGPRFRLRSPSRRFARGLLQPADAALHHAGQPSRRHARGHPSGDSETGWRRSRRLPRTVVTPSRSKSSPDIYATEVAAHPAASRDFRIILLGLPDRAALGSVVARLDFRCGDARGPWRLPLPASSRHCERSEAVSSRRRQ
jgi:hypothetical protein